MDIESISAHLEIGQILARYCRGVDRRDAELLRSVYHPDAVDDHGVFKGLGVEFADWLVRILDESGFGWTTHQITSVLIELAGDKAAVESYYLAHHPGVEPASGKHTMLVTGGRYLDRFERRQGVWRIAERLVTVDWGRQEPAVVAWEGLNQFVSVGGKGTDPSYRFLSGNIGCA